MQNDILKITKLKLLCQKTFLFCLNLLVVVFSSNTAAYSQLENCGFTLKISPATRPFLWCPKTK